MEKFHPSIRFSSGLNQVWTSSSKWPASWTWTWTYYHQPKPEPEPELNFRFSSRVQVQTLGSELNFNSPKPCTIHSVGTLCPALQGDDLHSLLEFWCSREAEGGEDVGMEKPFLQLVLGCAVGARGYLHSWNCFPSIFRIPPVVVQAPLMSHVNPMSIQDLTVCTRLVPL